MSKTSPFGNPEPAFDICELGRAAGATYVARGTASRLPPLVQLIAGGISHKGFSLVEVMSNCPTYYGRLNASGDPVRDDAAAQRARRCRWSKYEDGPAARPTSSRSACCTTWNARSTPRPTGRCGDRAEQAV